MDSRSLSIYYVWNGLSDTFCRKHFFPTLKNCTRFLANCDIKLFWLTSLAFFSMISYVQLWKKSWNSVTVWENPLNMFVFWYILDVSKSDGSDVSWCIKIGWIGCVLTRWSSKDASDPSHRSSTDGFAVLNIFGVNTFGVSPKSSQERALIPVEMRSPVITRIKHVFSNDRLKLSLKRFTLHGRLPLPNIFLRQGVRIFCSSGGRAEDEAFQKWRAESKVPIPQSSWCTSIMYNGGCFGSMRMNQTLSIWS